MCCLCLTVLFVKDNNCLFTANSDDKVSAWSELAGIGSYTLQKNSTIFTWMKKDDKWNSRHFNNHRQQQKMLFWNVLKNVIIIFYPDVSSRYQMKTTVCLATSIKFAETVSLPQSTLTKIWQKELSRRGIPSQIKYWWNICTRVEIKNEADAEVKLQLNVDGKCMCKRTIWLSSLSLNTRKGRKLTKPWKLMRSRLINHKFYFALQSSEGKTNCLNFQQRNNYE